MSFQPDELQFTNYFPGVIGKITEMHAVYYSENWGFDLSFETQVASELADFLKDFFEGRDMFLTALLKGDFAGSIAIDGKTAGSEGARLRWFIVRPVFHSSGIGRALIRKAIQFCRRVGHERIFLWTFEGLGAARHLYEEENFRLAEEHPVEQWGTKILEQKFVLTL